MEKIMLVDDAAFMRMMTVNAKRTAQERKAHQWAVIKSKNHAL